MNGRGIQVGSDAESFPGDGQRLSCKGDNCCELLLGGPVSGGVRNLNRSQGIYDLATCGREGAHRWEEGWTHGWRQGFLSGSVPPKNTSGACRARSQAAFFQLRQTCWKGISWPRCRGAQGSSAPHLGCFCLYPMEGSWQARPAAYRSKTRASAGPLLSAQSMSASSLGTRAGSDSTGPQREELGTRDHHSRELPLEGCLCAHASVASSQALPNQSTGVSLACYKARRGFVTPNLLFCGLWVVFLILLFPS